MALTFAAGDDGVIRDLHLVHREDLDAFRNGCDPVQAAWIAAHDFTAGAGRTLVLPDAAGRPAAAVVGLGPRAQSARHRFLAGAARAVLPPGTYRLAGQPAGPALDEAALGWLLAGYTFDRYRDGPSGLPGLVAPAGADAARIEAIAAGEVLTRDLINTPAEDMGPADLERAARALAADFGADIAVTQAPDLRAAGFPLIHAVGRAAAPDRAPRLIDMRWGAAGPTLTLVGKGVCFDTGGLNLKPGRSMGLMKKDMGGAAVVLGLARMLMATGTGLRLRVLVPAVENAISASAIRPGDVLQSRLGPSVEVNNTDAEGRLILADALALGGEDAPDLMVSMATLTGAARVALGPDLAPVFTDDDALAAALASAGRAVRDPVWRLPFWDPYEEMIEPAIADLDNAPAGGMAGAITAALFLRRFAGGGDRYAHFDIYGWQPSAAPGRPKGGVGQGARALFEALPAILRDGTGAAARQDGGGAA